MLTVALAAAQGLALGYLIGRLRPGQRLFERALGIATCGRRGGLVWAASVLLVLLALAVHPRRFLRHMRTWREPEQRAPAPELDPDWGRR